MVDYKQFAKTFADQLDAGDGADDGKVTREHLLDKYKETYNAQNGAVKRVIDGYLYFTEQRVQKNIDAAYRAISDGQLPVDPKVKADIYSTMQKLIPQLPDLSDIKDKVKANETRDAILTEFIAGAHEALPNQGNTLPLTAKAVRTWKLD